MPVDLLAALAAVPDPRARRGVRHGFVAILAIGICAVLAGAGTFTAVAEWAHDLPMGVRVRLGLRQCSPSESTIRRVLQAAGGGRRRARPGRLSVAEGTCGSVGRNTGGRGTRPGPGV